MYGVAENMRNWIWNSMKCWTTEFTAGKQVLREVKIKGGIFPSGGSVSPLIFLLGMVSVSEILQEKCWSMIREEVRENETTCLSWTI